MLYAVKSKTAHLWNAFFACPGCDGPLAAQLHGPALSDLKKVVGDLASNAGAFIVMETYPAAPETDIPQHLPDRVAKAFKEGCEILSKSPNAACAQFRRAMELGLKDLAPDVEAWKLEKRIDKLAAQGMLTESIRTWAHQLRLDGNEAVHGDEEATLAIAQAVESLTRYVLTYLYTLPRQVAIARGEEAS